MTGGAVALGATLTDITSTCVTFNAPASVTGAADATITATSVVNPATAASVTLIVLGKPQMNPVQLFPGNVNVPYAAPITVAGGLANFTWSPALRHAAARYHSERQQQLHHRPLRHAHDGRQLHFHGAGNRRQQYRHLADHDHAGTAAGHLPAARQLHLLFSGFRGGGPATDAGSITVDASGNITGEHDYKDGHRTTTRRDSDLRKLHQQTDQFRPDLRSTRPTGRCCITSRSRPPTAPAASTPPGCS